MKKVAVVVFFLFVFAIYLIHSKQQSDRAAQELSASQTQTQTNPSAAPLKDGEYTGDNTDAFYGNVQVKAVIKGGKIADIQFLDYPKDKKTSLEISQKSMPTLISEAIKSQSSQVDNVSGATQTADAFKKSLESALIKARS